MAAITREQVKKANEKMGNGFTLDVRHYVMWGEKKAHKYIDLEDGKVLECSISYHDRASWQNGFKTDIRMVITTSVWIPTTSGCMSCSSGFRQYEHSKGYSKKMFNKIQAVTHEITDKMIFDIDNRILQDAESIFENGIIC